MTTVLPFRPSNIRAPILNVTLDGSFYNLVVTWNVAAQRYYINLYDAQGGWVVTTPLVATPPGRKAASVVYNQVMNNVLVTMVPPEEWPVPLSAAGINTKSGQEIEYTLEGFSPDTYNGTFLGLHVTETTFIIPMPVNPGQIVKLGAVHRLLNMVSIITQTSSICYRNMAFEIRP